MRISIVVPCYNGIAYIPSFVKSLKEANVPPQLELEAVIVDNGSNDGSVSMLHDLSTGILGMDVRIYRYTQKQGSYATRNFAVSQCTGSVLIFTDIDCILPSNYFQELYEKIKGLDSSYIIAGNVELFLSSYPNLYEYYDFVFGFNMKSYVKEQTGVTANAVLPIATYQAAQGFDEVESGGDRAFFKKVVNKYGTDFHFYPEIFVEHPCRGSYAELLKKAKRVSRGHASYYQKLNLLSRLKRLSLLLVSAFIQPHQFKVILKKRNVIKELPFKKRIMLVGLIFWVGFYSRIYTIIKTLSN